MRAIQNYLPQPRHTEIHRIFVNTTPAVAWSCARHFDMSKIPWVKLLFDIRTFSDRLCGQRNADIHRGLGVDDITTHETGFFLLHETEEREVVVGAVGKFWLLSIPFEKVKPEDFRNFNTPGFGKIAWCIAVEPFREGSTVSVELRITATDERSWEKFHRYYEFIGIGSRLIRASVMSHLEAELGKLKIDDFDQCELSGDQIIPDARFSLTFHQDIEAPVPIVWRYLMQLGCDRAGWYSIDLLDNGGRPSTDHIVDNWTDRVVDDRLSATPANDSFFQVHDLKPEHHLIIGGDQERMGSPFKMTWAFLIEPIGLDACRLITRARMRYKPEWMEWLMGKVAYPPIHGLMSAVQLATIKKLAERDAHACVPLRTHAESFAKPTTSIPA